MNVSGRPAVSPAQISRIEGAADEFVRVPIHALLPGTWNGSRGLVTVTDEVIRALAESYDPEVYQAPVVLGHPEHDDPAWGEVLATEVRSDGLWLDTLIDSRLAELIEAGRYRAVSVSYWGPGMVGSPRPETYYLRHLGVLGAQAPAVKGLTPLRTSLRVSLTEGECVTVELPREEVVSMSEVKTDAPGAGERPEREREVVPLAALQLAEREAKVAALERVLAEQEAALAARERALRRAEIEMRIGAHVQAGRILAAEVPTLVALAERLAETGPVALADGERAGSEVLDEFFGRLPARVALGEMIRGRAPAHGEPDITVPPGYAISERGAAIWRRARDLQRAHNLSEADALRRAEREV